MKFKFEIFWNCFLICGQNRRLTGFTYMGPGFRKISCFLRQRMFGLLKIQKQTVLSLWLRLRYWVLGNWRRKPIIALWGLRSVIFFLRKTSKMNETFAQNMKKKTTLSMLSSVCEVTVFKYILMSNRDCICYVPTMTMFWIHLELRWLPTLHYLPNVTI